MNGKLFFVVGLILLLSLAPIVSAASVRITIKTDYPFRSLILRVQDSGGNIIESLYPGKVGMQGETSVDYETTQTELAFQVLVVDNGEVLANEKFDSLPTSEPIVLDLREETDEDSEGGDVVNLGNEEDNETLNGTQAAGTEEADENASITGQAIFNAAGDIPLIFYYLLIIIVIGGVIGFFAARMIKARKVKMGLTDPAPVKLKMTKSDYGDDFSRELEDAERKLGEAQDEINRIKGRDKIREAEEKLRKDQEELENLRKGMKD